MTVDLKIRHGTTPVPKALRQQVTRLLQENYAYMDSPAFRRKHIERELFTEDAQRQLPLTSWYQPTRDESVHGAGRPPQLMKPQEERLMFLRFNYTKKRLGDLQRQILRNGLILRRAQEFSCNSGRSRLAAAPIGCHYSPFRRPGLCDYPICL